jgi:hypothetical protein
MNPNESSKEPSNRHERENGWLEVIRGERYIIRTSSAETNGVYSMLEVLVLLSQKKVSDSKGRGRVPVRISYRLRFRHRQRGLIWISEHRTAVNRGFRLLSRDL